MSEATRFEVMKYWEARQKGTESSTFLVANISQTAQAILDEAYVALAGVKLDQFKADIKSAVAKNEQLAYMYKGVPIRDLWTVTEDMIEKDYIHVFDLIKAGLGGHVGGLYGGLYENLAGATALLQSYTGLLNRIGIETYVSRYWNNEFTPNIPDAETSWFMTRVGQLDEPKYSEYLAQNGWNAEFRDKLEASWTRQPNLDVLLDLRRRNLIGEDFLKQLLRWYRFSDTMIDSTVNLAVQYPEPYRLADFRAKAWISVEKLNETMSKFGLSSDWSEIYAASQEVYPDFSTALALLRRGEISSEVFTEYLRHNAYSGDVIPNLEKLKDVIPPIQDLIRFAVREAYLDHDPEKQYSEMVRIAGLMGLTPKDAEHYWYSHWERIPVNLMYANYHRGLWTVEKLERMLKIVDVHPDDRKDIINVAYGVPSIREMGYGFDVGVYTLEDIKRFRRWGGLSPADADKAGDAMVAYRTEAERNSVRTELMYAFGLEKIDEATLRQRLTEIKTPEAALELWVTRATLYKERMKKPAVDMEGRIVSSSEALTAFKLGLRTEEWLRIQLKALDWTDERINTAVERAKLEITEKETKDAEVKYRKLTLAQIKQMYTIHLINKEQMTTEYVLIGYSPDDAELLTEIYTREVAVEVKVKPFTSAVAANLYAIMMFDEDDLYDNFLLQDWDEPQAAMLTMYTLVTQKYDSLKTQYIKGAISGEQMVQELIKLEMPEYNARLLVKKTYEEYEIDRLSHEKDLTKAEIIKGVKNQVLTPSQGAELLQGIGYDDSESWYILAINKVVEAGDPDGYWEMRKVTEAYKKAKGEKALDIPDELLMLEKQLKEVQSKLNELKKQPEREEEIKDLALSLIPIEQRIAEIVRKIT
jgi:hypothetical protein